MILLSISTHHPKKKLCDSGAWVIAEFVCVLALAHVDRYLCHARTPGNINPQKNFYFDLIVYYQAV